MLYSWEKRKVVYMSPLMVGLCVLVVAVFLLWMNRDFVQGWISHVTPARQSELRGEWVGPLEIDGIHDPFLRDMKKKAVIRFNLKMTDSVLGKYGGRGELMIAGEKPLPIEVRDFRPQSNPRDGTYRTGIWLDSYTPGKQDDISGGFTGSFEPGSLSIERDTQEGYLMKGILRKGTDADYDTLVKNMQQNIQK
jgi:hypothetical protein